MGIIYLLLFLVDVPASDSCMLFWEGSCSLGVPTGEPNPVTYCEGFNATYVTSKEQCRSKSPLCTQITADYLHTRNTVLSKRES